MRDAAACFEQLVDAAEFEPQSVIWRGSKKVIVLSVDAYDRLKAMGEARDRASQADGRRDD